MSGPVNQKKMFSGLWGVGEVQRFHKHCNQLNIWWWWFGWALNLVLERWPSHWLICDFKQISHIYSPVFPFIKQGYHCPHHSMHCGTKQVNDYLQSALDTSGNESLCRPTFSSLLKNCYLRTRPNSASETCPVLDQETKRSTFYLCICLVLLSGFGFYMSFERWYLFLI